MMIAAMTLLSVLCLLYGIHIWFKEADIIQSIALSIAIFGFLFVIVSGFYFTFDLFSFFPVLLTILLPSAFFVGKDVVKKRKFSFQFAPMPRKEMGMQIGLVLFAFLLTSVKFELYCNGQDQGLYQAEALELYMGHTEVEHDFPEYRILTSKEDQATYYEMLTKTIVGYYPLSASPIVSFGEEERISDVSGMYHGVQTFPAVLALGAKLFGLRNMMQIQTAFFLCAVLLLYATLRKLGIQWNHRFLLLLVFLISPLVIWISKSSFTEMFLTMCVCFYLYLLAGADTAPKRLLAALPLTAFAFVHMSFLQFYPAFILVGVLFYLHSGHKEFLWANVLSSVGLAFSYFMMDRIAPQYFYNNASRLFFRNLITADNFLLWVYAGTVVVISLSFLLSRVKNVTKHYNKAVAVSRLIPSASLIILSIIIRNVIIVGLKSLPGDFGRIDLTLYNGTGFLPAFGHSSLYAFAMATGMFVLPYIIILLMVKFHVFLETPVKLSFSFLFVYLILVQSAFFNKQVFFYYYYSRYLVVCIPVICVMFAILFDRFKKSWVRWVVIGASVCVMAGFDIPLLANKDLTMLEWDALLDVQQEIKPNSAVIMDEERALLMGPQLRTLSGAALFPLLDDFETEVQLLSQTYEQVYFLTDDFVIADKRIVLDEFGVAYRNQYLEQNNMGYGALYPIHFEKVPKELVLYEYHMTDSEWMDISSERIGVTNGTKEESYISTNGQGGIVMYGPYVGLTAGRYTLRIPIEVLRQEKQSIGSIYIGSVDKGVDYLLRSRLLESFLVTKDGESFLEVPFTVPEYMENVEFIITSTTGAYFRIYSYEIIKRIE